MTPQTTLTTLNSPTSPFTPTTARILLAALVVGTLAIFVLVLIGGHVFIPDDVYFYLQIADNLALGHGSTFNGLQLTNGYHPSWMGVCVALRALVGDDPATRITALFVVVALGNLVALGLTWRLTRRLNIHLGLGALVVIAYASLNAIGSEFHLSLPLLLTSLLLALSRPWTTAPTPLRSALHLIGFGILLGLTVLARLDNVFAVFALGLAAALSPRTPLTTTAIRLAAIGLGAALTLGPYLVSNLIEFGHLVPISGSVKSGLAALVGFNPGKLGLQAWALLALSAIAPLVWYRIGKRTGDFTVFFFSLGALAHGLYILFFLESVWTWYFATELISVALTLDALATAATRRLAPNVTRLIGPAVIALTLLTLGAIAWRNLGVVRGDSHRWYLDAAAWVDATVPPDGAVAITNSPGSVAYFSHRPIVALDGLTGDFRFHHRAAAVGLYQTLAELGVTHVVTMGPGSPSLGEWIDKTRLIGHGGEGPTFDGEVHPDGTATPRAVGLYSGIVKANVGWLSTAASHFVSQCKCGFGMWRLAPGAPDSRSVQSPIP